MRTKPSPPGSMGTGCNDVELVAQLFPQGDEATTAGMGAGLEPQDTLGRPHGRHQARQVVSVQLVEHMADHQRGAGPLPRGIGFGPETREAIPGSPRGELHGQSGSIVQSDFREVRLTERIDHTARGHTAAASPVEHRTRGQIGRVHV